MKELLKLKETGEVEEIHRYNHWGPEFYIDGKLFQEYHGASAYVYFSNGDIHVYYCKMYMVVGGLNDN
jgi:hypothetical protein